MEKIVFTEEFCQPENLFPFTLTRQVQDIRVGILTIREKWERYLGLESFDKFEDDYKDLDRSILLDENIIDGDRIYLVHGNMLPNAELIQSVKKLQPGEFISVRQNETVIFCISKQEIEDHNKVKVKTQVDIINDLQSIKYPWDIFKLNAEAIKQDFELLTNGRASQPLSDSNKVINPSQVFIEEGVQIEHCILNAAEGPVYIGKNAVVMEGSLLRGPLAICEGAVVKMGTKIYGATTVGPYCTVGGEIKNAVFFGYSNKAHDGYLGDSVIGEWCNLGAGTSCSNVKNTASNVLVWTPNGSCDVGLKCGVIMGDYSRTAINTAVNTGTVIGVCSNVFGHGLTPKYIPSFSWGVDGIQRYGYEKALEDIENWKNLKHKTVTENEKLILQHIFNYY